MPTNLKLGPSKGTTVAKGLAGFLNLKRVFDDAQRQNQWKEEQMLFEEKNKERRSLRSEEGATKRAMIGERGAEIRSRIGAGYNPAGNVGQYVASGAPMEWEEGIGGKRASLMNAARKEARMRATSANAGVFNQNTYNAILPGVIAEFTGESQAAPGGGGPQGPGLASQAMGMMGEGFKAISAVMQKGIPKALESIFRRVIKSGRISQRDVQRLLANEAWDELNALQEAGLIEIDQDTETISVL